MHKELERTTTDWRNLNYNQGLPSSNTLEKTTIKWKSPRLQRTDSSCNWLFQNMYVESELITERKRVATLKKGTVDTSKAVCLHSSPAARTENHKPRGFKTTQIYCLVVEILRVTSSKWGLVKCKSRCWQYYILLGARENALPILYSL